MVRKLVNQQLGPVFTEKVKGHEDLRLGFQATSCECQMDKFDQTTAIGEWWLTAREPLHQVKLEKGIQTGIQNVCMMYITYTYDIMHA